MKTIWIKLPSWLTRKREQERRANRIRIYKERLETMPKEYKPFVWRDKEIWLNLDKK